VGVVLALPPLIPLAGLSHAQYGILAGLTVYEVLAATFPVSAVSGQLGTLVKLDRVLLLGPVVAIFAFLHCEEGGEVSARLLVDAFPPLVRDRVHAAGAGAQNLRKLLTVVAMAGLGLGVELGEERRAGPYHAWYKWW
jgi:uncharacterized membrane protein YadS